MTAKLRKRKENVEKEGKETNKKNEEKQPLIKKIESQC